MNGYTPTTEIMRDLYASHDPEYREEREVIFDRWLAERDAQVRAEAVAEFIAWADSTPAVTWTGKGGIKDRWAER